MLLKGHLTLAKRPWHFKDFWDDTEKTRYMCVHVWTCITETGLWVVQMLPVSVEATLKFVALIPGSYVIWRSKLTGRLYKFKGNRGTELRKL